MTKKNKLKKGDQVKIISGRYKNYTGTIIQIFNKQNTVIIKNINLKTKHTRPKKQEDKGEIIKIEAPINKSNIKIIN